MSLDNYNHNVVRICQPGKNYYKDRFLNSFNTSTQPELDFTNIDEILNYCVLKYIILSF